MIYPDVLYLYISYIICFSLCFSISSENMMLFKFIGLAFQDEPKNHPYFLSQPNSISTLTLS